MTKEPTFPDPKEYFLYGSEPTNDVRFVAPVRKTDIAEPLVDGIKTFISMEEAIHTAQKSVYLSFWIFNPKTKLLSKKVRTSGVDTWGDLLHTAANRNVEVRVILSDFDPLFSALIHRNNWETYRELVLHAVRLGGTKRDMLQVICSLHEATVSVGLGKELQRKLTAAITQLNSFRKSKKSDPTNALIKYRDWPGLWSLVEWQPKKKLFVQRSDLSLVAHPATHHQKLCIIDETIAYCGGLDVNSGRKDNQNHHSASLAWHDIHCRVEGPAAFDICRNFVGRWNNEVPVFTAFVKLANGFKPPSPLPVHTANASLKLSTPKFPVTGKLLIQVQRTKSVNSTFSAVPTTVQDDVKRSYERAIKQAQKYIYIENQYVRSLEMAQWLIDRAAEAKDLQIIIVLPVAPEEVAAKGGADPITMHGLALQHEVFVNLRRELKGRIEMFSLIQKRKGRGYATEMFGSPQIYVHSKLLLIDDRFLHISSANTNPRSFYVDTELGVAVYDPTTATRLRLELWREHLGNPAGLATWTPPDFIAQWTKIATTNETTNLSRRQGFAVRHDMAKFPGAKSTFIPNEFASVFDLEIPEEDDGILV